MLSRLFFVLVSAFFIIMNGLLWRSQFGTGHTLGSGVPPAALWEKMLLAPDASRLEIRHHGKKIGYGTWEPKVGDASVANKRISEEIPPEGMITEPSGYSIDFSGNFSIENFTRLRFGLDLTLTTNHQWQELSLHLGARPSFWEVQAKAAAQTVKFTSDDDTGHSEQVFKLADFENPEKLFHLMGGPLSPAILGALGLPRLSHGGHPSSLALKWEARNDWLKLGKERMRIYRLQGRLMDRFQIVLFISLEGEILRGELPDEIVLINDQLAILQ